MGRRWFGHKPLNRRPGGNLRSRNRHDVGSMVPRKTTQSAANCMANGDGIDLDQT
jgi:hypothetical protein